MSLLYCIYNGKKYKAKYKDNSVKITTTIKEEGFSNYIDVLGRVHHDLFMKELSLHQVEWVFYEEIEFQYKGKYFPLCSSNITPENIKEDHFKIFTDSEKMAQQYNFEKKEQFVFEKNISKSEIESIRIIQKPINEFENYVCKNIIISEGHISEWFESLN